VHVLLPLFLDGAAEQQHIRSDKHQRTGLGEEVRQGQFDASISDVNLHRLTTAV
jgi:hypothetical protein